MELTEGSFACSFCSSFVSARPDPSSVRYEFLTVQMLKYTLQRKGGGARSDPREETR